MIFDFLKREDPGKSLSIQMKNAYLRSHSIFQFFLFFMFIYASRRSGLPLVITWCAASYMAGSAFHLLGRYIINTEKIRSLSVQRHFSVTADEAMEAATGEENKVYLGNGYIWSVECAQAYHELMNQTGVEHIINLEPEGGGKTFLHNIGIVNESKRAFRLPEHTMIVGSTGVGKTELIKLILGQIIERADQALVIIDPKGDRGLLDAVYKITVKCGRERDFKYFTLSHPNKSDTLNLFANHLRSNDIADRIRSIISVGQSDFSNPFLNFNWMVVHATADLMLLCRIRVTTESLYKYVVTAKKELYEIATREYKNSPSKTAKEVLAKSMAHFKSKILDHDPSHFEKMVASLIPVLTVLGRGEIGRLLSPDVASIQWGDTIQNRRIVFISLPAMIDDFSTSAVGRLFVGDLVAHIGQLYAYNHVLMPVWLHVEEWYSVAFGKWVDVLNKARAAGVQASLSMQTSADITAALKKEITAQILTNTANKIFLRTPELELANEFSELFGEVMVPKRVVTRSINSALDKTDNLFKSGMSERLDMVPIPLVSPTMLTTLPRGEGFIQTQGFPPIKMRFPLLDTSGVAADSFFNRLNPEVPLSTAELEEEAAEKLMGEQMSLEMEEEGDGSEPDEQPDDPLAGFVGLSEEDFQK